VPDLKTFADLIEVAAIAAARTAGLSLQRLRIAINEARRHTPMGGAAPRPTLPPRWARVLREGPANRRSGQPQQGGPVRMEADRPRS